MKRILKSLSAFALLTGLLAVSFAPDAHAETKDAEAKRLTEKLKAATQPKEKAETILAIGKLAKVNKKLGEAALPEIKKALADKDVSVRKEAALAFGRCDPEDSDAVKLLIGLLKDDKSDEVKVNAAMGLAAMGEKAKEAVPALQKAAKDTENKMQDRIYKDAIKSIGGGKKKN